MSKKHPVGEDGQIPAVERWWHFGHRRFLMESMVRGRDLTFSLGFSNFANRLTGKEYIIRHIELRLSRLTVGRAMLSSVRR